MANEELRVLVQELELLGVDQAQIARVCGVLETTFQRALNSNSPNKKLIGSAKALRQVVKAAPSEGTTRSVDNLPTEMQVLSSMTPEQYAQQVADEFAAEAQIAPHGSWNRHLLITSLPILESRFDVVCEGLLKGVCRGKRFDYFTFRPSVFSSVFGRRSSDYCVANLMAWSESGEADVHAAMDRLDTAAERLETESRQWPGRAGDKSRLRDLLHQNVKFYELPWQWIAPNEKVVVMLHESPAGVNGEAIARIICTFRDTAVPKKGPSIVAAYSTACDWYRSHFPTSSDMLAALLRQPRRQPIDW